MYNENYTSDEAKRRLGTAVLNREDSIIGGTGARLTWGALPVALDEDKVAFIEQRNFWTLIFLGIVSGIGVSTFI